MTNRLSLFSLLIVAANASPAMSQRPQPTPALVLRGHTDLVSRVRFSPDGRRLATASQDNTAAVWDAATGKKLLAFTGHDTAVRHLAFSPDGRRLATAGLEGPLKVWEAATGRVTLTLDAGPRVVDLAFSPLGDALAAAGVSETKDDFLVGEAKVWGAEKGTQRAALPADARRLAYSPDGKRLAVGCGEGEVVICELGSGQAALTLPGDDSFILTLTFSPDGRRLATATSDGELLLRDLGSGEKPRVLRPEGLCQELAFSPDGRWLAAAGGRVGEAWMWDTQSGKGRLVLSGDVRGLCFSPDGTRLATAHGDGTVKLWSVKQLLGR